MITFNNIVERFRVFADAHFFVKSFSFGSPDDVDLSKFTNFPLMHLVYTGATYDAGTKTYNLEVYILDVPADKEQKTDRQKEVVSDAEQCAEDIIADIKNGGNIFLFAQDYDVVNATTTPLEEETKNVLSGVLLDLSVAIPYEWDACNAPIDGVSPEGGDEVAYARRGILRMLTENGVTDVLSVRTIKVTNGTLTDEGDGVVTLDTGGATELNDLDDVGITDPVQNQTLLYNMIGVRGWYNATLYLSTLADTKGTPTEGKYLKYTGGFWQPADVAATLGQLTDVDTSGQASGYVLISNGSTWSAAALPIINGTNITRTFVGGFAQLNLNPNITLTAITADTLKATGDLVLQVDSDNNGASNNLIVKDGANNEVFRISEAGVVTINQEYSLPTADGTANQLLKTDGAKTLSFGANLQDLDNVSTLTPSGNQVLTWSGSEWQPAALPSPPPAVDELNDLSDVSITTPLANQILRYTGSVWSNEALTQYHDRYQSDAATLRSGATATTEIYYSAIADGDGYAESASSDTPATGYDIRRKLYYSEAGFADPNTGTWVQFATIPDDTTFASAKATLLAYLKERTGGTVPISLKMTWEEVAEAATPLLDTYTGAAAAYSLRKLRTGETQAVRVRRASDNTEQDIGFDGSGGLDTTALASFCSGTDGFVVTWYDQSGNNNDATQSTTGSQAKIYDSATGVLLENSKPCMDFASSKFMALSSAAISDLSSTAASVFTVCTPPDTTTDGVAYTLTDTAATSNVLSLSFNRTTGVYVVTRYTPTATRSGDTHGVNQSIFSFVSTGASNATGYEDGTQATTTPTTSRGAFQNAIASNSATVAGSTFEGTIQELVIYASNPSRTGVESNLATFYGITL